jgi:hypothetical protein
MRMHKAALILGSAAFLVATGATLLSPLCAPCAAVFLGLVAGYVAGVFDKPLSSSATTRAGAAGGAVGAIGAVAGQMVGAALNAMMVGPQGLQNIYQQLGLPTGGPAFNQGYWFGIVGGALCFSVLDILLMAGFGALGGLIWWQTSGRKAGPGSPTFAS